MNYFFHVVYFKVLLEYLLLGLFMEIMELYSLHGGVNHICLESGMYIKSLQHI